MTRAHQYVIIAGILICVKLNSFFLLRPPRYAGDLTLNLFLTGIILDCIGGTRAEKFEIFGKWNFSKVIGNYCDMGEPRRYRVTRMINIFVCSNSNIPPRFVIVAWIDSESNPTGYTRFSLLLSARPTPSFSFSEHRRPFDAISMYMEFCKCLRFMSRRSVIGNT